MLRSIVDLAFDLRHVMPDQAFRVLNDTAAALQMSYEAHSLLNQIAQSSTARREFRIMRRNQERELHMVLRHAVPMMKRVRRKLRHRGLVD